MTLNEALALQEGDTVCHPAALDYRPDGTPVKKPLRVTKAWVNGKRTIVSLRIASVAHDAWVDATGYELPPEGKAYDRQEREWVATAELKRRKLERRNGKPLAPVSSQTEGRQTEGERASVAPLQEHPEP